MKNLLVALALFVSLIVFGSFVITRSIEAQNNDVLSQLLELPAPPPPNPSMPKDGSERPEEFYSKKNPPADNAPLDELMDYWERQNQSFRTLGYNLELSGRSLDRILSEIEKNPEKAQNFLNVLPENEETAALVKRIYDQTDGGDEESEDSNYYAKNQLKNWLRMHSPYFSDELAAAASSVGDTSVGYVSNQDELLALSRVDWNKAKPILDRLYNDSSQPVSQTLARWAFYRHALDTDSLGDVERYRDELKKDVENTSASDGLRDLAFDALVKEKDFSGRDEWYFSLLSDETLADLRVGGQSYTGLTTLLLYAPPEKYADRMIELVKSSNQPTRNAAVRNLATLLDDNNPEVVKALLPWLENKNWAKETSNERQRLVTALANMEIPESVPGLIALLDEKDTREIADYSSTAISANTAARNANSAAVIAPAKTKTVEYYPFRSGAISALAKQKNPSAVPALRRILPIADLYERGSIVRAIYLSNGFSIPEQIAALEASAQSVKQEIETEIAVNKARINRSDSEETEETEEPVPTTALVSTIKPTEEPYGDPSKQIQKPITAAEIKELLGQQIIANPEPSPELLAAVVARINVLDRNDRMLADALRRIMLGWQGAAVNLVLLNDVKNGKADISAILKLLSIRKELREKQINDVYATRSGGSSFALGLSACLLETQGDFNALLVTENWEAKAAMFGCARLIRAPLPLGIVAQNLSSPNKPLARAAELYLESEDSPQARAVILAKYPNQAKILGATTHFGNSEGATDNQFIGALFKSVNNLSWFDQYYLANEYADIEKTEKKLQKEIISSPELLGVYAYDNNFVRIYQDRIMYSFAEDESRYRERYLTPAEFDNLKNYFIANRVDEQLPYLSPCGEEIGCIDKELLMLGRQGGRRVYQRGYDTSEFFKGLDKMFEEMQKAPAKLRYELEKSVAGLEILFADDNLKAETVWKNGGDLRVLIADTKVRERVNEEINIQETESQSVDNPDYAQIAKATLERRAQRAYEHYSWRKLTGENSAELTTPPDNFQFPPARDALAVRGSVGSWKAKAGNVEIRADENGLYKISGVSVKKIREGSYSNPVITPDGRWAVAAKFDPEEGSRLVRVNLANNQEFAAESQGYGRLQPAFALPSGKKVLFRYVAYDEYYYEEGNDPETSEISAPEGDVYVFDVETGAIEKAKGELRPLASQTFRPLQKSSASADDFWAAIGSGKATQVGIYNMKTMTFKPSITIPNISFDSMNMWVDEAGNKVYFVYKGQLLALSLAKK